MLKLKFLLVGVGAAVLFAACGDSGAECGTGTVEVDGTCVPSDQACGTGTTLDTATGTCEPDISDCATGTVLMAGECVPDGSVICETGTTYNATSGKCDADITGCATGTVLISGECVPYDDTLVGDVTEGAEPNGGEVGATPSPVDMPAVGSDVVISGCVGPQPDYDLDDNGDSDLDFYVLQATGPTLLDVTIDGVGGMSGGYAIIPTDGALSADGWFRFAVNLVGDTTQRQVFLPKAGVYILAIADSRSLWGGLAVGDNATTCYFATVANVALPTPTVITAASTTGTSSSDVQFYSYDPAEGDTLNTTLTLDTLSGQTENGVTTLVDNTYVSYSETPSPAQDTIAGLADASVVMFAVEEVWTAQQTMSYGFTFDIETLAADGTVPADGTVSVAAGTDASRFYFDAAANDVVRIEMDGSATSTTFDVTIEGPDLGTSTSLFTTTDTGDTWVSLPSGGRYYLNVTNTNAGAAASVTPTFKRTHVQSKAYTFGTPVTDVALADGGHAFYRMDLSSAMWISVGFSSSGFGGTATLLGEDAVGPLAGTESLPDGLELIVNGGGEQGLLHVVDDNFAGASTPIYTIDLGPATFDDKMAPTAATPVADAAVALAAGAANTYGVSVGEDATITITVTGTGGTDVELNLLGQTAQPALTKNDTGADGAETYTTTNTSLGSRFIPFSVTAVGGGAGTYNLDITVVDPPYKKSVSKVNMTDVCDTGSVVDLTDGLSAAMDIGFNFPFFGADKTKMFVSEEGFIVLDAAYGGTSDIGDVDGGDETAVVMNTFGFGSGANVCILKDATSVTVQWRADPFGLTTRVQIVLRTTGRIDVRYGSDEEFVQAIDAPPNFSVNQFPTILFEGQGRNSLYRGKRAPSDQIKFEPL